MAGAVTAAERRRLRGHRPAGPPPDERRCIDTAVTTGHRCAGWAILGSSACSAHARRRRGGRALTGSVAPVELSAQSWRDYRFGDRAWQAEAWRLYDITGQLRFVSNWVGNSVSRCRLFVAEVDESGEAGQEAEDPDVASLAAGPLGAGPAKDEALRLAGINLFVPGECYIVAEADGLGPGDDRWFVVSGRQVKRMAGQIIVKRSALHGGGEMMFREGVDLMLRCWTPHPADVDEPDSPARSAIPDLREIEAIRKREFAELDSRLAGAGLLPLPQEIDFPASDDDPPGLEGLQAKIGRAMATSMADRSSASAMVPIMFKAPAEHIDKIKHITFWSELSSQLLPMREAAVRSLAQSLDIPPEVLLGLGSSNHWSAWAISEEAVTTQIVPVLSRIADALTQGYLRRALEHLGKDPDAYVYAFDTAPLTTRPNRAADALNFWDRDLISDEATRLAGAFADSAPTPAERVQRIILRAVQANPQLLAEPIVQQILDLPPLTAPAPAPGPAPRPGPGPQPVEDEESPPDRTPQTDEPGGQAAITAGAAPDPAVAAVASMAVHRALELAGGRLVSHRERDRYPGTPRHELHVRHGAVTKERAETVLRGAWDSLPTVAAELTLDAEELQRLLHGYCCELLTRGMAHDRQLLVDLLTRASVGPMRPARQLAVAGAP